MSDTGELRTHHHFIYLRNDEEYVKHFVLCFSENISILYFTQFGSTKFCYYYVR